MKKFDLQELLQMQEALDQVIFKKAGVENREEVVEKIEVALMVELGELANEWQGFKYWKAKKNVDRNKVLEEWSDCLHFALSLDLYYMEKGTRLFNSEEANKIIKLLPEGHEVNTLFLLKMIFRNIQSKQFNISIMVFDLGFSLGFSLEEMVQAYESKRNINFKRVSEGY